MNDHKILYIVHWDEHQVAQKESTGTLLGLAWLVVAVDSITAHCSYSFYILSLINY